MFVRDFFSGKSIILNYFVTSLLKINCALWEGLPVPQDTKFWNFWGNIIVNRAYPIWSLIHESMWFSLIYKIGPGLVPNHTQSPLKFCFINFSWHNGIFNSLRLNDAYIHQLNIPKLVQIMACRLFSTKPFSEPMLWYSQLGPTEHISMKFYSKFKSFHSR